MNESIENLKEEIAILHDAAGHNAQERDHLRKVIAERNAEIDRLNALNKNISARVKEYVGYLEKRVDSQMKAWGEQSQENYDLKLCITKMMDFMHCPDNEDGKREYKTQLSIARELIKDFEE